MKITRVVKMAVAVFALLLAASVDTYSIPNPNAINWSASPTGFVTSLYVGVLGRSPESTAVVNGWATQVNSNPSSRLNVFWKFVGSPEYQASSWAKQRREYNLYQKYDSRSNRYTYSVSKGPLGAEYRVEYGPTTFGIAMALRGYYATFVTRR